MDCNTKCNTNNKDIGVKEAEIRWTRRSINYIARHGVQPYEIEECLFENAPVVM